MKKVCVLFLLWGCHGVWGLQNVVVAGGGIGGLLASTQLRMLKSKDGSNLFNVTLLEKKEHLFSGASEIAAKLHMGGEYPKSLETALDCLRGAILFRQMLKGIYTNVPGTIFGVMDRDSEVNFLEMTTHYEEIRKKYESYIKALSEKRHTRLEDVEAELFGESKKLYEEITADTLRESAHVTGFEGSIYTPEKGIHPVLLGTLLEERACEAGVKIMLRSEFLGAQDEKGKMSVTYIDEEEEESNIKCDLFINAGVPTPERVQQEGLQVYQRAMIALQTESIQDLPFYREAPVTIFSMMGNKGGMFCPVDEYDSFLYYASPLGCQIIHKIDEGIRKMRSIDDLSERFTFLNRPEARESARFIGGKEILSGDKSLKDRRHVPAKAFGERGNYISTCLPKATFAPIVALETVKLALEKALRDDATLGSRIDMRGEDLAWILGFASDQQDLDLPACFSLGQLDLESPAVQTKVTQFAERRGILEGPFGRSSSSGSVMDSAESVMTVSPGETPFSTRASSPSGMFVPGATPLSAGDSPMEVRYAEGALLWGNSPVLKKRGGWGYEGRTSFKRVRAAMVSVSSSDDRVPGTP